MGIIKSFDYPVAKSQAKYREVKQPNKVVLSPNKRYTLVIDYPLNKTYRGTVVSGKSGVTLKQLLDKIVAHYYKIYKSPSKYQIWGHAITDLAIESMNINHGRGIITLSVGS